MRISGSQGNFFRAVTAQSVQGRGYYGGYYYTYGYTTSEPQEPPKGNEVSG
jgi:hypothetical protein